MNKKLTLTVAVLVGLMFGAGMAANLSKRQLVSANTLHAFPINYCPMCDVS